MPLLTAKQTIECSSADNNILNDSEAALPHCEVPGAILQLVYLCACVCVYKCIGACVCVWVCVCLFMSM